ncbi:hypothetical protein B0A58_05710 [Flavobacterium branchiophilum NBRC 15030 = ATCC 35035]|nr:hypothetical protein B0A58_05710 [Flavobacterium branchiophilum NBRC 15030 = ATCC 35035]GEM56577.1 hypothetical protein FB1_27980 [Flavobacterium branchiophilum NBRC 15030 = ATCC 35035]
MQYNTPFGGWGASKRISTTIPYAESGVYCKDNIVYLLIFIYILYKKNNDFLNEITIINT